MNFLLLRNYVRSFFSLLPRTWLPSRVNILVFQDFYLFIFLHLLTIYLKCDKKKTTKGHNQHFFKMMKYEYLILINIDR